MLADLECNYSRIRGEESNVPKHSFTNLTRKTERKTTVITGLTFL